MSDSYSVTKTRSALARLSAHNRNPDPDEVAEARANLACANIDQRIRESIRSGARLGELHAGHLIGLLLSHCHIPGDEVDRIEAEVRALVRAARAGDQG